MTCSPLRGALRFSARLLKPRCASRGIRQIKAAPAFLGSQHFLPPISPLSKKGKRKEKKYLKRKRDPSCLEGFYQVKVLGPHKHASSPIILDPAPDAHEEKRHVYGVPI